MAKRPSYSNDSPSRVSKHDNINNLLESFITLSDSDSIDVSFDHLLESKTTDSDQNDFIQRTLHVASVLLEAGKRSDRKRSSIHNALVWPLPPDLTVKVFAMTDTQTVCNVAATCSFFHNCSLDPLCFAHIDLSTSVHVTDAVASTMVQRAGNELRSIRLGIPRPFPDVASGLYLTTGRTRRGKDFSILTTSCLSSLSANGGAAGSRLRRLHVYNIEMNDTLALHSALSVCPSLVDLEIAGLDYVGVRDTLQSVSSHCPLLERFSFEKCGTGGDNGLVFTTYDEFFLNCPNITTLALRGFNLTDHKADSLVKGFPKLKYVDFSASYSFTGSILKNLGISGGGKNLEVIVLRDCEYLKQSEVKQFLSALLVGDLKHLRHLDISNADGLASDHGSGYRLFDTSFIPTKQLLEQRPNLCLVAEFPDSYCEPEQMASDSSYYESSIDGYYESSIDESSGTEESNSEASGESADEQRDI